jgi:hypothetical protein
MMAFMAVLGTYGVASAVSLCCAVKPCKERDAQGKCLTPNAGKACNSSAANPTSPNSSGAGCVEVPGADAANSCAGGDPTGPAGCIAVGGAVYITSSVTSGANGNPAECTDQAVDACCAAGACH